MIESSPTVIGHPSVSNAVINHLPVGNMNGNGFWVPNGSSLVISIRNLDVTAALIIYVRVMVIDKFGNYQQIQKSCIPAHTDGTEDLFIQPLMEGFVQSAYAFLDSTLNVMRGLTFASLSIKLGTITTPEQEPPILFTLASDYIETNKPLSYPGSGVTSSVNGAGFVYTRTITNTANAAVTTYTVPDNLRQRIQSFRYKYAVAGGLTAQKILFQIKNVSGIIVYEVVLGTAIAAGASTRVSYISGVNEQAGTFTDGIVVEPLPMNIQIYAAQTIVLTPSTSPQAGDAMSDIRLDIEQWIEPRTLSDPA